MPKIKRIDLPEWTTVDRQLHDAAVDLLPAEMAEDSLARWVIDYDGLTREFRQEGGPFELFEREWHEDRGQTFMVCYLASSALQTRLPFYFAALFHIGRMRQVSQAVLETIPSRQQGRIPQKWASSLKKHVVKERLLPTSWNDFVQRIFENEWVERIGGMAGAANKKAGQTAVVWALNDFVDFVEMVVARLNGIGYSLRTPPRTRLETLLEKTSRGESVYGEDAW